jgi:protein arginine kinase
VDLGIIKTTDLQTLNELIVLTQPGYLQKLAGQEMGPVDRDMKRALIIREKLGS